MSRYTPKQGQYLAFIHCCCRENCQIWNKELQTHIWPSSIVAAERRIARSGIRSCKPMAWIRTVPLSEAGEKLRQAIEGQKGLYPIEYATPVHPTGDGTSGIVASHSLIPDALLHAFSTFGTLMSPDLPLSRRQHEMIATMVSVTNHCHY
jgi:hypothetical protein